MATRKTKGKRKKPFVGRAQRAAMTRRLQAKLDRTDVPTPRSRGKVMRIRYVRTTTGRVRFIPLTGTVGSRQSYASRQGARRAARKLYKGFRVVAVVPERAA